MLKVRVVKKYHDAKGILIGYTIQDESGKTMDVHKDQLKNAVANGQCEVVNMTLTSDGRLIGSANKKSDKQKVNAFVHERNGEELLQIFTNGKRVVAGLVDQKELASNTWGAKQLSGLETGYVFQVGHEVVSKANALLYDNIKVVDGKPDLSSIKRRSFAGIKPKLLKILKNEYTDASKLNISVEKGDKKYEYIVRLNDYDDLYNHYDKSEEIYNIIYCLLEDVFVTSKMKVLYIDEDTMHISCLTGISDVRKALKLIGITK